MLVKAWQADGMQIWVTKEATLSLVASTNTYTINTKMMRVIQSWRRDNISKVDVPLRVITRDQYNRLGNKSSTGTPVQLYHEPGLTTSTVKVFPTPTSTDASSNTIYMVYQKQFDDFDTSTDNPEFPSEYFEALKFGLAVRLAFEYGMEPNDRKQLAEIAAVIKQEALSFGTEEGSLFFGREYRSW
jgi:hypothetical protein